jgi:PEGA domain-containing protein
MNFALAEFLTPQAQPNFADGFGERRQAIGARNERLELLRLSSTLSAIPTMEAALRDRAARLSEFRHESFARPRAVDVDASAGALLVYSDHVSGVRLSSLLAAAEKRSLSLDLNAVHGLVRQLVRAVAAWHEALPDIAHGAIGPERIIIAPSGKLVIADCVLGSAIDQLRYSRDRYWSELRVALPPAPAVHAFDARTDVAQIGLVALALVLGRRLTSDIYPGGLSAALQGAWLRTGVSGALEPLPLAFRDWLRRAMQLDPRDGFVTARDASVALDEAIGKEDEALERDALHVFLARCLALDVRMPAAGVTGADDGPLTLDPIDDVASEVELGPRIEALRAFLARYPSHAMKAPGARPWPPQPADASHENPTVPLKTMPTPPVPIAPAPPVPIAPPPPEPVAAAPPEPIAAAPPEPIAPSAEPWPTEAATIEPLPSDDVDESSDNTMSFEADAHSRRIALAVPGDWSRHVRLAAIAILVVGTVTVAIFSFGLLGSTRPAAPGTVSINTSPAGIPVMIDGVRRGVTPLDVDLPPSQHLVELLTDRGRRQFPVTIKSGSQTSLVVDVSAPAPPAAGNGELLVRTEPPGASVNVDGRSVGRSPVSVAELAPGPHTVILTGQSGSVTERVLIEPGRTASLLVPMGDRPAPGSAAGWIAVTAPADVQVFEGDRFLGTNRIDRIMMPVGRHDLEIVNEALGYRERRTIQVAAGQVAGVRANWPNGTLAINAVPWAEVFVDGMPVGETPIGSIQVAIGAHEVVFRHPQLGERRAMVTVTTGSPAKVGVDLRSK